MQERIEEKGRKVKFLCLYLDFYFIFIGYIINYYSYYLPALNA